MSLRILGLAAALAVLAPVTALAQDASPAPDAMMSPMAGHHHHMKGKHHHHHHRHHKHCKDAKTGRFVKCGTPGAVVASPGPHAMNGSSSK